MKAFAMWILVLLLSASVVFADYPRRIVSGMPSITEILFALDLEDKIVGVTTNCNYPPEARRREKVGGFFLNLEKVSSLKPDLILMLKDAQKREIEKFKSFGLPVKTLDCRTLNEVLRDIIKVGELTGRKKEAERLVEGMKKRMEAVRPSVFDLRYVLRRPRVFLVVGYNPLVTVGGGTFLNEVLTIPGAENIAAGVGAAYPQYSFEQLLRDDPDYIIILRGVVERKEITADSRWQRLNAVRKGRVFFVDPDIFSRPGPRLVEAVEIVAKLVRLP